jgi:hypothetical protein
VTKYLTPASAVKTLSVRIIPFFVAGVEVSQVAHQFVIGNRGDATDAPITGPVRSARNSGPPGETSDERQKWGKICSAGNIPKDISRL